ncbi:DUF350 domain-containing protein [Paenibacillus humicus]|uniref:DUF350 domain-containing protein n=1 Tax=Paenibacillus humicus TaxID=412861 RepID=UPI000FD87124|nr:DUF350 domain-containing protein [Paenibacillus humicus]
MTLESAVRLLTGTFAWTAAGALLLALLMAVDSLTTRYKDLAEMRKGNVAVTTRFIMKLFAQGYILAQAVRTSYSLGEALIVSVVSFVILLIIELVVRRLLDRFGGFHLDEGTKDGKIAHALLAGSLHLTGALIVASTL